MRYFFVFTIAAMLTVMAGPGVASAVDEAGRLYESYGDAVYQVQVIDLASNKKTSIGSGFQFTADGLIATNYHVIAEALQRPANNRIEFLREKREQESGEKGRLEILMADVVHDLAIVRMDRPGKTFLTPGSSKLPKGTKLFALGNPHDIGFTIIEGSYSGLSQESLIDKIHFSGSLNPGMSGGPAIGHDGKVVGINVATAGNQISFLVPVERLHRLVSAYAARPAGHDFIGHSGAYIERQLQDRQERNIRLLLKQKWESVAFGPVMVPGRLHEAMKCWGGINHKEKDPYQYFFSSCSSQDQIFLDQDFDTGAVFYRYDHIIGKDSLNLPRFYSFYQQQFAYPLGDYQNAREGDVANFDCNDRFVDIAGLRWKSSFCVRQYKKYPSIFDMHLYMALVDAGKNGLTATLVAQGVSKRNALDLAQRFMHEIKPLKKGGVL